MSWAAENETCSSVSYNVRYAVIRRDQCEDEGNPTLIDYGNITETHVNLTGLYPYSTYKIYVHPFNENGSGPQATLTGVTKETGMYKAEYILERFAMSCSVFIQTLTPLLAILKTLMLNVFRWPIESCVTSVKRSWSWTFFNSCSDIALEVAFWYQSIG